jgi:hypothetical protein
MRKNWIALSGKLALGKDMDLSKPHSVIEITQIGTVATFTQFRTYATLAGFVEAQQRNCQNAVAFQSFVKVH